MGDHTECFQVDFDPEVVSYDHLLELFWQSHDPTRPAWKTQYASLVLARDDKQLESARSSAEQYAQLFGKALQTRIEFLDRFYLAEDYHQKYYLQNDSVLGVEFRSIYPRVGELTESTAAARANGYLYGAGSCARLERDLPRLGLSRDADDRLKSRCR